MDLNSVQCLLLIGLIHLVSSDLDFEKNVQKTWKGTNFHAFRGIKYAESPSGPLRFRDPVRAKTWQNITAILEQDLNADGNDCPSPYPSSGPYNEDCLFLNVYTKRFNCTNLLPVIVFIHPGGLWVGSGSSEYYGPHYLLEEDVLLVTLNHRLGFFGFTSKPDKSIGNAGFKDQSLALAWIQDHIHHFGGDKDLVTLMGDSAGALSVAMHLASPMSRNYFHRAFLMSGGLLPQKQFPKEQDYLITKLAKSIGCADNQDEFDCINRTDATTIVKKMFAVFEFGSNHPIYPLLPVLETEQTPAKQRFIDRDPFELFASGNFAKIPIIVTVTKDEFKLLGIDLFRKRDDLVEFVEHFERAAPSCYIYKPNETVSKELYREYVKYSLTDTANQYELFKGVSQGFSDSLMYFPQYRLCQLTKNYTDVYFMKFEYRGSFSNLHCDPAELGGDICDKIIADKTVVHTDDLLYIFTSKSQPMFTAESDEGHVVSKYTKMLAQFARAGQPGTDINDAKFAGNKYEETYIKFDGEFSVAKGPFENAPLWDRLYPLKVPK